MSRRCCDSWLSGYRDVLSPAELMRFYDVRRAHLRTPTRLLALDPFTAAALPAHPQLAAELHQRLLGALALPESEEANALHSFEVHTAVAASVTDRSTLELDGGIRLIIPADGLGLVQVESQRTTENKVRIVIETLTLKEVSDR